MAYLLNDVEALLAAVKGLGARYQKIIPESVQSKARLVDLQGGPNAWLHLALEYPGTPGLDGVSTLGIVAQQLDGLIARERRKGKEPDLALTKMRGRNL